jgi:peptidoglycan/LPS O-acetylase OafA/YrhL
LSANTQLVDLKTPGKRRPDLPALTGLRFVAALMVFFCHAIDPTNPGNYDPAEPFTDSGLVAFLSNAGYMAGLMAMSCFFMLSGFVITWSSKPGEKVTAYWRRRVVKIFPSHAVTWALAMVLFAGVYTTNHGLLNLFMIDTWFAEPSYWGGANGPAWSLNAEMLFYILFPVAFVLIKRIPESKLWLWAGGMVALAAAACLAALWFVTDTPVLPFDTVSIQQFWFVYFFPPMRLMEFVLGMIVARIVISGRWPRIPFTAVVGLAVVAYLAMFEVPSPYKIVLVSMIPLALVLGTFASANLRGQRTVLGTKPMVWLGKLSFGFFLTQSIVLYSIRPAVFGDAEYGYVGGTLLVIALFFVNLACGWLLFNCVELPAMKYWSRSKKNKAADQAARAAELAAVPGPAIVK